MFAGGLFEQSCRVEAGPRAASWLGLKSGAAGPAAPTPNPAAAVLRRSLLEVRREGRWSVADRDRAWAAQP